MHRLAVLLLVGLIAVGCGGGGDDRPHVPEGGPLTIYTSLPRLDDRGSVAAAVLEGQRLALADRGGRAGGRPVKLVALEAAKPDGQTWDPALVEANAKRAADDPAAMAYIGELEYGGSAISVPVTNEAGILQLSPYDGLTSLTREQPGGPRGGPERYYPDERRTLARLVPTDLAQSTALVDWALEQGATRLAIVHDDHLYGRGIAGQAVFVADARKLAVAAVQEVRDGAEPDAYAELARSLAESDEPPDAIIYAGVSDVTAAALLGALERALPAASLFAAGVGPERPPAGVDALQLVAPARPVRDYPARARAILGRIGERAGRVDPPIAALYGYEAMRLALDAIDRAGPGADRAAVVREALRAGPRERSALGDLALTPEGDVADQRIASYRSDGTASVFVGLRTPNIPALPPAPGDPAS